MAKSTQKSKRGKERMTAIDFFSEYPDEWKTSKIKGISKELFMAWDDADLKGQIEILKDVLLQFIAAVKDQNTPAYLKTPPTLPKGIIQENHKFKFRPCNRCHKNTVTLLGQPDHMVFCGLCECDIYQEEEEQNKK